MDGRKGRFGMSPGFALRENFSSWPKLGGQIKEILFLDSNEAHVLREFQADMGEYQASRGRDMGVPQNINATKCSLKKHLRGR